jgi:signal peptidase I
VTYADGTLIGDGNGIFRTDENGEIRIEGLKPGKSVIVTETKAPDGFIIDTQSQTVQIKEGNVYIDGVMLSENEQFDKMIDPGIARNELLLENDEFFVLGDNRNSSEDSRSGNIGAVAKDTIVGKAWFHMAVEDESMGLIE